MFNPDLADRRRSGYFMKVFLLLALLALPIVAQIPETKTASRMTEKDREFAINQLNASREKLASAVAGLSEAQLKFKSAPDRWSVAEVAEHITLAENFLFNVFTEKVLKTTPAPDKEKKVADEQVLALVTDRSSKFQAPEPIKPASKWSTTTETLQEFNKRRAHTIDFVKTTKLDLRNYFSAFGPGEIDGLQWLLIISGHTERHIAQINEVKADPNFPKK